jgi:deoxyribose-phosphate aldolase
VNTPLENHIEHSLLRPTASLKEIQQLCKEAIENKFYGVCVHSCHTLFARYLLRGTAVKLVTVIGFPLGTPSTETKVFEACNAIENGADELDMMMHLGALKYGDEAYVVHDISQVKKAMDNRPLKVIIESSVLDAGEIRKACRLVMESGADFVKTSTGFAEGGARLENVRLIREMVGDHLGIKASGGISTREAALEFLAAGATRIGTSAGLALMKSG